jgi:hypothetical protein
MKRKVRTGRIVAVVAVLAVAALLVVAGSGCAGWGWGWGNGNSHNYYQGSCHHNNYCGYGGDGNYYQGSCHHNNYCGGGCSTGVYIYYNVGGGGKCGKTCWPVINPPERPDCENGFCDDTPDDPCSDGSSSSLLDGGFGLDVPQLDATSLGLEKPAIPTIP